MTDADPFVSELERELAERELAERAPRGLAADEHATMPAGADTDLEPDVAGELRIVKTVLAVLVRRSSRRTRREVIQALDNLEDDDD